MQLMRVEKDDFELLRQAIQESAVARGGGAAPAPLPAATGGAGPGKPTLDTSFAEPRAARATSAVHGRVQFPGGSLQDVYVYVENVKSAPVHSKTVEIAQRGKQFVPEVAVVQRGTKVVFPNYDTVYHNVFSPTAPRPFDLGSYRAGEESKSVDMLSPGVIDVYCNMHSAMHASILVVPSPLYARVAADGSFHLDGVPLGTRKVVVWGPRSKPTSQTVELGSSGADMNVTLEAQPATAHNNKEGRPYASYDQNKH
jgi:plastocyanin